ncbi:MAG: hypothetical protein ABSB96_02105 [Gaiellaceae bacterium]
MSGLEKVGSIAAVVAAVAAVLSFAIAWHFGRRAKNAVKYERLREARDLVETIFHTGNNTRWPDCNEAASRLRALVAVAGLTLPHTRRLSETKWDMDSYRSEDGLQVQVGKARDELERAARSLS